MPMSALAILSSVSQPIVDIIANSSLHSLVIDLLFRSQ